MTMFFSDSHNILKRLSCFEFLLKIGIVFDFGEECLELF
ncbi:hypothetical protein SynBIOSE41_04358 [Synechococcus sp. BIOS-E4-1]|nr:hypothetical protein SynBIOSE41_04358 [Synechococcus sp. BIOS-E4-1]